MFKKRSVKGGFNIKLFLVILVIILFLLLFYFNYKDSIRNNKDSELTGKNSYPESPPVYSEKENIGPPPSPPAT